MIEALIDGERRGQVLADLAKGRMRTAAIAALHDDAASAEETDWPQILAWYDDLVALTDDPVRLDPAAVLGRAVAVGHVLGAAAGLRETDRLREVIGERHRWHAVRGHLHELGGNLPAAAAAYAAPAGPRTSPSATTWSARPPAREPRSYAGTVVSLSVLHRLAYPAMTRLSRAWSAMRTRPRNHGDSHARRSVRVRPRILHPGGLDRLIDVVVGRYRRPRCLTA